MTHPLLRHWKAIFVALLGAFVLGAVLLAQGPDLDLRLERDLPSKLSLKELGQSMFQLETWPKWFFATESAEALDILGRPYPSREQTALTGEIVRLLIDPKKGPSRKFTIMTRILEFIPEKRLKLEITGDSHDRLKKLFDHIVWTVEVEAWTGGPLRDGTMPATRVRMISEAHTAHWRSRLFGRIAEKILLNQTFYPNILVFSGLELPTEPGITSPTDN